MTSAQGPWVESIVGKDEGYRYSRCCHPKIPEEPTIPEADETELTVTSHKNVKSLFLPHVLLKAKCCRIRHRSFFRLLHIRILLEYNTGFSLVFNQHQFPL
jgi:hypothetical protein